MKRHHIALLTIFLVLLIDQWSKIWIKTNLSLGESIRITEWFRIYFIENNGMAFGIEFGGDVGKLLLTLFRSIAIVILIFGLRKISRELSHLGIVLAASLIVGGAIGNLIDSIFYGVLFDESIGKVASFLPQETYAPVFFGRVVDMFYFPFWEGHLPEWFPFLGGQYFVFFQPIFNVADLAISVGFGLLVIFQKKLFGIKKISKDNAV